MCESVDTRSSRLVPFNSFTGLPTNTHCTSVLGALPPWTSLLSMRLKLRQSCQCVGVARPSAVRANYDGGLGAHRAVCLCAHAATGGNRSL